MKECVFCKIIKGELKASKKYEDELVIAFLDANPVSKNHTLIVPKKHYENIYDTPKKYLQRIITVAKKLAKEYKKKQGIENINLLHASGEYAEQSVFHYHMHLIPRKENDGLRLWLKKTF